LAITSPRVGALTYKTFPVALAVVHDAAVEILKHMGMRVLADAPFEDAGAAGILASGWRRQLHVELEPAGLAGTRARVLAKEGIFFEENVATEFVV
jgi:hypothetical protein